MSASVCKSLLLRKVIARQLVRHYSPRLPESLGGRPFIKHLDEKPHQREEPPENVPSLAERLAEKAVLEEPVVERVDIGETFRVPIHKKEHRRFAIQNKNNPELERQARQRTLLVPLDEVREQWLSEAGPVHRKTAAEHYGIYKDLFNDAYFTPVQLMNVHYDYDDEFVTPIHTGNKILPSEASLEPYVEWESHPDSLWTLVMTAPDSHFTETDSEYLHWMVGNIPGCAVEDGDKLCDYLMPFPAKGTGWHRYVFLLYRQSERLDYSMERLSKNCRSLAERTFRNLEFYSKFEDVLTPVSLAFFQSEWEPKVRDVFHHVLDMREPVFEYVQPPQYRSVLRKYPLKQPFDRYYDRYRDKKDIAEEVVRMKLDMVSPFEQWESDTKYPLAHLPPLWGHNPTWLRKRQELAIRRQEQFKDLPPMRKPDQK